MFSRIFIERPRLAMVISILITLGGLIAIFNIPVAELPHITPPVVRVSTTYPGASAEVVRDTVAAPIEQEVNGVDDMLYMESTCSDDGSYSLQVTFSVDSNPDIDQVNVQNRLQLAQSRLPQEVLDQGIDVRRRSEDMLGVITFTSPQGTRDRIFMSNYIDRVINDALVRIPGVSDVHIFGEYTYSMRIWLDPDRLAALQMSPDDVVRAVRRQNIQATLGSVGTAPAPPGQELQYTLKARGRLNSAEEFENIVIRSNEQGGLVRLRDVGRMELGSESYSTQGSVDNRPTVGIAVYKSSDANALNTMNAVREELKRQAELMPEDMDYMVMYDTTDYVRETIKEIVFTLGLTFLLVVLVIFTFLQNVRATIIPAAAIPVSIIGTFAVLLALGFSANTINLFALILAIGVVVDDAIIVVENVYRVREEGSAGDRKEAAIKAMEEITGPIVATTLVLLAVFVPIIFMPGITGGLYKQFGVTLCVSVVISAICSLTLSPALCAVFLKASTPHRRGPFAWFNMFLGGSRTVYTSVVGWLIRHLAVAVLFFVIILGGVWFFAGHLPTSFLPQEDKGGFFADVQLPEGATLERSNQVLTRATEKLLEMEGVEHVLSVSGFSLLSGRSENVGFIICDLKPWEERTRPELHLDAMVAKAAREFSAITTANITPFVPPPIQGLGTTGGFDFRLQALAGQSPGELVSVARGLVAAANQEPSLSRVYTTFTADTPQIFVDLDRTRAEQMGVAVSDVFSVLGQQTGSRYVNDFNLYGRTYQVRVQGQAPYRAKPEDIQDLYVLSEKGKKVPLESLVDLSYRLGSKVVNRYNLFTSLDIRGEAAPGYSSGQAMATMERLAGEKLPSGYGFEWSSMSYQEKQASGTVVYMFALALIFAYLFLVGLYESWNLPVSIVLSVLVATLGAFIGLWVFGRPLSLYAQIGVVLLVGLAAKNAILIVEFARDRKEQGASAYEAALGGAGTRFRPVLMTALTFILGVAPLVVATGAGASSRNHIGTVVFAGMIAATTLGILIIPALYYIFQRLGEKGQAVWQKGSRKQRMQDE
ncbi:efflux RND transporter permease subunit [Desulfovermiculus halophilus]|uniref:efflux RND transporter permease subunit n=1 Tax=Desulfovermiculus halophilus TaxID=339722 RepID=UPI0004825524|nr:multidrug efflux RND transporter permease subunit [Desulfovermiculus halophilus]